MVRVTHRTRNTLLALLACAAASLRLYSFDRPLLLPPSYATAELVRGDLAATVLATGNLSPLITVQVGSQVSGTIEHLFADFNGEVKKDEVIAQTEPSLFKAELAEPEARRRRSS